MPSKTKKDSLKKEKTLKTKVSKELPVTKNLDSKKTFTPDSEKIKSFSLNPKVVKYGLPLFIVIVLGGLLFYFKGQFIPVIVNGTPIFRGTLISELEKKSGKETLDNLIIETLILQKAKEQKVVVTDDEINAQVSSVEQSISASGTTLEAALKEENMTLNDFRKQIKLQKIVEKIVLASITVSDEEVKTYIDTNKLTAPEGTSAEDFQNQTKETVLQQKKSTAVNEWITELQTNAKIQYFLQF